MSERKQRGFTLLEMMVVVVILLILSGVTIPSLLRSIRRYQTEADARNIANILTRARYQAIQNNQRVSAVIQDPWGMFTGNRTVFGIDLNGNEQVDPTDPQILPSKDVYFIPVQLNTTHPDYQFAGMVMPQDWPPSTTPMRLKFTFSPDGTVVMENPYGSGNWQLAGGIQAIFFLRGWPNPANFERGLVTVTPTGRIRSWRFENRGGTWGYYPAY